MSWDPKRYARFSDERLRPALDLLARVELEKPVHIVDLGCGSGAALPALAARWPDAKLTAVDSSAEMLSKAREVMPHADFIEADASHWRPAGPVDLVFSNAVLHWLDDHETLVPDLLGHLTPGGVLAVQVPDNWRDPCHTIMEELADLPEFRDAAAAAVRRDPVLPAEDYYRLLAGARRVDIWKTAYFHVLEGNDPIYDWLSATSLGRILDTLDEPRRAEFAARYKAAAAEAYPKQPDGKTLYPLNRLFFVAEAQ